MQGHVTSTLFCKSAVNNVHTSHKEIKSDLADVKQKEPTTKSSDDIISTAADRDAANVVPMDVSSKETKSLTMQLSRTRVKAILHSVTCCQESV